MFLMHYHYHYVALILDVCCVDKPPIDEVIQSGVVPRFVQFLDGGFSSTSGFKLVIFFFKLLDIYASCFDWLFVFVTLFV